MIRRHSWLQTAARWFAALALVTVTLSNFMSNTATVSLVLPVAVRLAQHYKASLILGSVVQKPDLVSRLPVSEQDALMVERVTERNQKAANHYLEQVQAQLSLTGIEVNTRLEVSSNALSSLHNMVEDEKADLVMLVAHGRSARSRFMVTV